MRFVISSSTLSTHLGIIGRVIVQKNNLPILDCFLFDIQGNTLTVTASDNDSTLVTKLELNESDSDVRFAVNAKILQDAIKEIPEQPLTFDFNDATFEITINYQNGQYKLMAQNAEDYPSPALIEDSQIHVKMDSQTLFTGIVRSMVAVANDSLRPQLNAICFDVKCDHLCIVTCNGNQLALTKITQHNESEGTFLLNTRPASLLKNMLTKEQDTVTLSFGQRGAIFSTEEYTLICRLVEGKYPNYPSLIPTNNNNVITINRQALMSVLRRVMIFANPSAVLVKIRLGASTLNISSQDIDFGKSAEENMFCDYSGVPMSIAFKGSTLLELLQNIECDEVLIKLSDPTRAGLIVPTQQKEGEEVLMLVMPSIFN